MNGHQIVEATPFGGMSCSAPQQTSGSIWPSGLGNARAADRWRWAPAIGVSLNTPTRQPSREPKMLTTVATSVSAVRIPEEVLQTMREVAWCEGRSESEIWAEAAREWLRKRQRDDEPQPPTPAAAALPCPRLAHAWREIDSLLADLRMSPEHEHSPVTSAA